SERRRDDAPDGARAVRDELEPADARTVLAHSAVRGTSDANRDALVGARARRDAAMLRRVLRERLRERGFEEGRRGDLEEQRDVGALVDVRVAPDGADALDDARPEHARELRSLEAELGG